MFRETLAWPAVTPFRQLKEDPEFYIPDYIAGEREASHPDLYAAADRHASELRRAERYLDDAINLTGVLRAAMQEDGHSSAAQADTVLKIAGKLLSKAHSCIDRHDTRFMNLFMAHFDARNGTSATRDG